MEKIFKAKRLDNGECVEFSLKNIEGSDFEGNLHVYHIEGGSYYKNYLDKNTICQYTGINDSEGNRIFEGDELDYLYFGKACKSFVTWNEIDACFNCKFSATRWEYAKLTGHNIHDRG